ncbi:MAG: ABC transporter permease [Oscillospiraceae bacterium]|nr:ABC transporter permease [Oscillospiraceae bacterium]
MKSIRLRYLTREGVKNIGTNRLMSFASVAVLMSCLVMIGCAVLLYFNIDALLKSVESQNVIMVFVEKDADEKTVEEVKNRISALDNIESVEFISRDVAYDTVLESLGDNSGIMNGVDSSFLPDAFEVTVSDMEFFSLTVNQIRDFDHILSIRENSDLADRLEKIRTAVSYVCIGIIILLFIVALFIIANTIRITMFTRRLEISIMKAVGATNSFIRWPFLIEGVTLGIIAAVLSMGVLYLIYYLAGEALLTIFGIFGGGLINFMDYAPYLLIGFICVSVVTAGIGSIFSIGKYLKEQGSVVDETN